MRMSYLACLMSSLMALAPSVAWSGSGQVVNPQITDAVTQTNVKVVGEAPGQSMGSLYESTTEAMNASNDASD
jgi:hypothetical protein